MDYEPWREDANPDNSDGLLTTTILTLIGLVTCGLGIVTTSVGVAIVGLFILIGGVACYKSTLE